MIDDGDVGPTGGVSGLTALQLEKLLMFTLFMSLLLFGVGGCAPGDWGTYRDASFWHDRDHHGP